MLIATSRLLPPAALLLILTLAAPLPAKGPKYTDPRQADAEFAYQGEYVGQFEKDGERRKVGVQVIALGDGKFRAVGYRGGLPGDGWDGSERHEAEGELQDGVVRFESDKATAMLPGDGTLRVTTADGIQLEPLKKVERKSPTLGEQPPAGAVVLFDGSSADAFQGGRLSEDGLLMEGATSKQRFGDHRLHLEFRLPYQPQDRGQGRGNSGVYVQGRYEVQVLDSFGLEGKQNECGGIYSVKDPDVNMCFPPLAWQTYDIDYTAARYDEAGKLLSPPRMTVRHNGVVVHKDVTLPADRSTTAAPVKPGPGDGPVFLQNHGCPVRYRNIWVLEK